MIFAGAFPAVPFAASEDATKGAVTIPEGITLTAGIGLANERIENERMPHFWRESTDAEEIRQRLMGDFDRTMLGYFDGKKYRKEAIQYLANRNDPDLDNFYYKVLRAKDSDVGTGDPVRAYFKPKK